MAIVCVQLEFIFNDVHFERLFAVSAVLLQLTSSTAPEY